MFDAENFIDKAYEKLIKNRKHFPPNSDIWDLRFHWPTIKQKIKTSLSLSRYHFQPMQIIKKTDGSTRAIWSSQDTLVINMLMMGCVRTAPRALFNHAKKLLQLYEQIRKLPAREQAIRMKRYLVRWERWQNNALRNYQPLSVRDSVVKGSFPLAF